MRGSRPAGAGGAAPAAPPAHVSATKARSRCQQISRNVRGTWLYTAVQSGKFSDEELHYGRYRCACAYLSRQNRPESRGSRRGLLQRWHVRRWHGRRPACGEGPRAHHAFHRALRGDHRARRHRHQRLHREAVPGAPRVHRLRRHATGFRGPRSRAAARRRAGPARRQAPPRHAEGRHGRPAPYGGVRHLRAAGAARGHPHGRLPLRLLAPAPPGEHPAHVPRPGGGRRALRLLVALRGGLRHPARGCHERPRVP